MLCSLRRNLPLSHVDKLSTDKYNVIFKGSSPLSKTEIQRRLLEAVEYNSLKCLDVLSKKYEENPISTKNDVERFHRPNSLSFWPVNERPKVTALHVLANKLTSTDAMKVLKNSKFLYDFSDVPDSQESTPLLQAIKSNNIDAVKVFLNAKPNIRKRNNFRESPIHVAALNDQADVIEEILKTCEFFYFFLHFQISVIRNVMYNPGNQLVDLSQFQVISPLPSRMLEFWSNPFQI